MEAGFPVIVADPAHRAAHQGRQVDPGGGGHLAGDDRHAGGDERLAGDPAGRVVREDLVEDRIGDLVGHLVGMAFGDGFGSEDVALEGHRAVVGRGSWVVGRGSTAARHKSFDS